jgi:hypothetical protein
LELQKQSTVGSLEYSFLAGFTTPGLRANWRVIESEAKLELTALMCRPDGRLGVEVR